MGILVFVVVSLLDVWGSCGLCCLVLFVCVICICGRFRLVMDDLFWDDWCFCNV